MQHSELAESRARRIVLVFGGARSGKSAFAEDLVAEAGFERVYIATGRAWDHEMADRIRGHQNRRGREWRTIEAPMELTEALAHECRDDRAVLVDCLTLWITNLMMEERDVASAMDELTRALASLPGLIVLVTNEVGLGIVPENRMARAFRDHSGRLSQAIAAIADEVVLVAAGLPLRLKG